MSYNTRKQGRGQKGGRPMSCSFWSSNYKLDKILAEEADKIAQDIRGTSSSQLRNFYSEVKSLQRKYEHHKNRWNEILPLIKLIKAKVKYASAKASGRDRITKNFVDFISKSIDVINSEKQFEDFCLIFEAVVGYHYYYEK